MNISRDTPSRLLAVLLAATATLIACQRQPKHSDATTQRGRVLRLVAPRSGLGLQICDPKGITCARAAAGSSVPAGSVLRTAARSSAQLQLADGSALALDHDTEFWLASGSRQARLSRGAIVLELASDTDPAQPSEPVKQARPRATLTVNEATLHIQSGKVALRAGADFAVLDVLRGMATLTAPRGAPLRVGTGEEARSYRGSAPYVSSGAVLAEAVAFTDELLDGDDVGSNSRGLGELVARKPGGSEELRGAVQLASHRVKVRIAGAMARTEIEEVFENVSNDVLEGVYRFPIPAGAKIERLALEVDGKLEEGAFVDRDRAAAIWRGAIVNAAPSTRSQIKDDIVWVRGPWRDPALLEWQRGGRFELKIFPIPKRGQRRIVLAYTESAQQVAGVRHYTYPLPVDPGGTTLVRQFDVDIEVRGQDPAFGVRTLGYPLSASDHGDARALTFDASNFAPSGDLSVEWALPDRHAELSAFGYRSGEDRYARIALRPKLPRATLDRVHATALVVDTSRSMYGEGLERARRLATRLARELDPAGLVTVLACDSTCRELPDGLVSPGAGAASTVERYLRGIPAEGASNPSEAVAAATRTLRGVPESAIKDVVYLGDGTPTVGPIRSLTISSAVHEAVADSGARVVTVAIGSTSDWDTLSSIARAGGGVALPYAPGQRLTQVALGVLSATYGSSLRDVQVVLPSGLSSAAPEHLDTILAGAEACISARMDADAVAGPLILRGTVDGAPFEQRFALRLEASDAPGNAFVPRLYAADRIADLERIGAEPAKQEALALSTRFSVASRYSSLLVLESEAMIQAFGLHAAGPSDRFTGREVGTQSDAEGELPVEESEDAFDSAATAAPRSLAMPGAAPVPALGSGSADRAAATANRTAAAKSAAVSSTREERFAIPPPTPAPTTPRRALDDGEFPEPRRPLIAMRRIWDRKGQIKAGVPLPSSASVTAVADAERSLSEAPERRASVKKLYALYAVSGDVSRATSLVERWVSREPLDPEALTARADLAARSGERDLAIRLLGSVVDVRPDDIAAQKRLARLYRWSGRPELGCRHAIAIAELRPSDGKLLADALRCARATNGARWASDALSMVDERTARAATLLSEQPTADETRLVGDLRVEATWTRDVDLDLAILQPDGQRVSWLGAATRELISARDVRSTSQEGLALAGAKPGEYVVEIVRSAGSSGTVSGELSLLVAGDRRVVPFTLAGQRMTVLVATIKMVPRLVPLDPQPFEIAGGVR